ncbi:hypothetical protein R4172_10125 [Rhodococcus kroppenstedtii]|uniref:Uncharacterized protein n=1 Tax=Rhodococcoides kroppenstedtii TaxID=293050 RepID=A0A1I0SFL0_9NOCA|nr:MULTISPECIES: hypothetical protein [Rhodococcus]AMY18635.1 hypothetical protein A3Q40_01242 [Rhodococcus sp. PBTS 1]MBT1191478.1 hypothetical protein [Rhodococcus kroppenstedtii]MBY6314986.1 hypothetical protein [Rhodococcus kroppenstedtii]MBY6320561.1 hypothetical protein [Rhodococcus kroppenstedtii]MBY6399116.1 hypothetical protein [Rhodococcus kroppenstedtii]
MTTFDAGAAARRGSVRTVDLAGTPWPVWKLEALVVGLVLAVAVGSVTALHVGVLTGAAAAVALWLALPLAERSHRRL